MFNLSNIRSSNLYYDRTHFSRQDNLDELTIFEMFRVYNSVHLVDIGITGLHPFGF